MKADGTDVQQLTDSPALDAVPSYSPDGRQIVFSSDRAGKDSRRLFVMGTNGSNPTRLIAGREPSTQMLADWQPVHGPEDPCTIRGTINNDTLVGTGKADVICGLRGSDTIFGLGGNDRLIGGPGTDQITGGPGADVLLGDEGNDLIYARDRRRDVVNGGEGTDTGAIDKKLDVIVSVERRGT